jgi:hypothetical protein
MPVPYLAPSLVVLRVETNAAWPVRDRTSDGWIGDAAHSSRTSDHNPDPVTGVVRATDTDEDLDGDRVNRVGDARPLVDRIVANRDPRVAYIIYEHRIVRSYDKPGIPRWTWAPYDGVNPHAGHAHVSILHTIAAETDTSSWLRPRNTTNGGWMPYPVYYVPNGGERGWYLACGPGGAVKLTDEEWQVGRDFGWWRNPVPVNERQYDVLASLSDRLG